MNIKKTIYLSFIIFMFLNFADAVLTFIILSFHCPFVQELNVVFNPTLFNAIIKVLVLPFILGLLTIIWIQFYRKNTILLFIVLLILDIIFVIIVINNVHVLCQIIND